MKQKTSNLSKKYDKGSLVLKLSIVVFDFNFTMVDKVSALERNQTSDSNFSQITRFDVSSRYLNKKYRVFNICPYILSFYSN